MASLKRSCNIKDINTDSCRRRLAWEGCSRQRKEPSFQVGKSHHW